MTISPGAIVVGAGPAGSVAALVLARAGVRVRLIDRASFPRPKLCGDTLNPGALSVLDALGLGRVVRPRGDPLTGIVVTGPGGAAVAVDYPAGMPGLAIGRQTLDAMLLDAAVSAGADFLPAVAVTGPVMGDRGCRVAGVRIRGRSRERTMCAPLVIAADGRHSPIARALELTRNAASPRRWAFGAYFAGVEGLTSRGEMHIRTDGYIGVAPLEGGIANVCVVRDRRHVPSGNAAAPGEILARTVSADFLLRPRFHRAVQVSPAAALGPLAVDAARAGCPGLLLAGDAAGFVDPMTGDGLRFALRGGELAAEAALMELDTGIPAHSKLRSTRSLEFSSKWRFNRVLRRLVASPLGTRAAAAVAVRWAAPFHLLVRTAADLTVAQRAGTRAGFRER